jgi:hypothetical protein
MNGNNKKDLKAFVRYDGSGRVVAGSLILRRKKPKVGKWTEIQGYECCTDHTLTTTVATDLSALPVKMRFYCGGTLGSELLSSTGWTSTGWTGSYAAGFTHTTGNTTALSNTLAAVVGKKYVVSVTLSGAGSVGSVAVVFGGVSTTISTTGTTTINVTATGTGNLTVTPTSTFVRTVVVSIKEAASLVLTLTSTQSTATTVANLVTALNSTYPVLGTFSTTGGTNLTLVMTDLQKQAICSGEKTLSMTVTS